LPIRVGTYPAGATKEEKWTLLKAVLSIGRDAGGIIPQGMKIDFQNAAEAILIIT
jgi:phage gp29-like protein